MASRGFQSGPGVQGGNNSNAPRVKKVMTQAINLIFEFLQKVTFFSSFLFISFFSSFFDSLLFFREIVYKYGYMKILL